MKKNILFLAFFSFIAISMNCNAQSISSLLNKKNVSKVVSEVTGSSTEDYDIVGTWTYEGSAVELKSSNVLKSAGGKLATSTIEDNLDSQFSKVGITQGAATFTFASDSTFTVTLKNKTQKGTYSVDKTNSKLDLTFAGKATMSGDMSVSDNQMTLTFDAEKLVSVVSYISKATNNSSLTTISSLLGSYDDVRSGFTLTKQ